MTTPPPYPQPGGPPPGGPADPGARYGTPPPGVHGPRPGRQGPPGPGPGAPGPGAPFGPPGAPLPGGGPFPGGQVGPKPQKKRKRGGLIVLAVALPVVLIAAAIGGVLLLRDGGSPDVAVVDNPDVPELAFPDPESLDFSTLSGTSVDEVMDSADDFEMCDTIAKLMEPRGYDLSAVNPASKGGSCRFYTPGMSLLTDGSLNLLADVGLWQGDSEAMYDSHLEAAGKAGTSERSSYKSGKVENFPLGDEGFIHHMESAEMGRSDATAVARSGDFVLLVAVWGSVHTVDIDDKEKPLGKEVTYREIFDIVKALGGKAKPGEPQISRPKLKEHPTLAKLQAPRLPELEGRKAEEVCADLARAADRLGLELTSPDSKGGAVSLDYSCSSPDLYEVDGGDVTRSLIISFRKFHSVSKTRPLGELGRDAEGHLLDHVEGTYTEPADAAMYDLPFADSGYALYEDDGGTGFLRVGYVIDDLYVTMELSGYRRDGFDRVALTEDTMLKDLATLVGALGEETP